MLRQAAPYKDMPCSCIAASRCGCHVVALRIEESMAKNIALAGDEGQARQKQLQALPSSTSSTWASPPDTRRATTIIRSCPADRDTSWFKPKSVLASLMVRPGHYCGAPYRLPR